MLPLSQMIVTNHYPLSPLYYGIYRGLRPSKEQFLGRCMLAIPRGPDLIVYYTQESNLPTLGLVEKHLAAESLSLPELRDAYHRYVRHLLERAGLLRTGRHQEYFYPNSFAEIGLNARTRMDPDRYVPDVRGYRRWTWDIEVHSDRLWLVPRLGLRFVTREDLANPGLSEWLRRSWQYHKVTALNLNTGRMESLAWAEGAWVAVRNGGAEVAPLPDGDWHITLSMEELKRIHHSKDAFLSAHEAVHARPRDLSQTPFAPIVASAQPLAVPAGRSGVVSGNHLKFGRGPGNETKQVMGRGLVQQPTEPVRLIICAPAWIWEKEQVKKYLRYQLFQSDNQALREELHLPLVDTVQKIWKEKWWISPYDYAEPSVVTYTSDGVIGDIDAIRTAVAEAKQAGRKLVCLLLLPDVLLPKEVMDGLHSQFRGRFPVVQFSVSTLTGRDMNPNGYFGSWVNITSEIAVRSGAQMWDLYDVPGVTEQTVFLGIDLGHNHRERKSNLAFTLFDYRGRPLLRRHAVNNLNLLDERLPKRDFLQREIHGLLHRAGVSPEELVVHRDGRFLEGEDVELKAALSSIPAVSLIGVKKDSQTQFHPGKDGLYWCLTHDRALLLTNIQGGSATPLEVELRAPGRMTLQDAVAQVFWLSRVYQGNVMLSPKLPVTTGQANNVAGTGRKVHIKRWARGTP